jgi:hypothetical protein
MWHPSTSLICKKSAWNLWFGKCFELSRPPRAAWWTCFALWYTWIFPLFMLKNANSPSGYWQVPWKNHRSGIFRFFIE